MSGRPSIAAVGIGLVGGVVSGLLGVGGGIVMVPGLVLLAGLGQRRAHATSLAAIIPIGVVGATFYAVDGGQIHAGVAGLMVLGAVVGAPLGVRVLARMPEEPLRLLFVLVCIVAGVRLLMP